MEKILKDVNLLKSPFKERVIAFLEEAKKKWFNVMPFETLRTPKRQQELYAIWRTTDLNKYPLTWTLQSKHLTGNAIDIVFKDANWNPSWQWDYKWLIALSKKFNLKTLWIEQCHFEV